MSLFRQRLKKLNVERLLWIGVLAFVAVRVWPQLAAAAGVGSGGTAAPEFEVETLAGEPVALSDLRGQVVLVNFWATWCPPCRVEMPGFQNVYEEYRDEGFTILGLSTDVGGDRVVREFIDERGITFPVAYATPASRHAFGGVSALPMSFLIDRQGRIRHTVRGIFAQPALEQAVKRLLAEPAGPVQPAAPVR